MSKASKRIESIKIVHALDSDADTSTLGEYTDHLDPWAILRSEGEYIANLPDDFEYPSKGREFRAFLPYAGGMKAGSKDYQDYGKADFARAESLNAGNWCYIGIYAVAEVVVGGVCQTIRSGGLWGVESDSGDDYFGSIETEELGQLTLTLLDLGFRRKAIESAIEEVEHVEA